MAGADSQSVELLGEKRSFVHAVVRGCQSGRLDALLTRYFSKGRLSASQLRDDDQSGNGSESSKQNERLDAALVFDFIARFSTLMARNSDHQAACVNEPDHTSRTSSLIQYRP